MPRRPRHPRRPVQRAAERIRTATGAEYVEVLDRQGIRPSHPSPGRIGRQVSTDPAQALAGHDVMEIDDGTLGRSARGKVPLRHDRARSSAPSPSASPTTASGTGSSRPYRACWPTPAPPSPRAPWPST